MSNTLFYSNSGLTSWQIGINAEVLLKLSEQRERSITVVKCDSILSNCFFNQVHNPIGCALCQSRQQKIYEIINAENINYISLKLIKSELVEFPYFKNLNQLIEYEYKGINVGRGVASSLISYFRDFNLSSDTYHGFITQELIKSINVYENFIRLIKDLNPKEIYLFNGRFSEVWPIIEIARKNEITFHCIESGSPNKYELFKNSLPHSISNRSRTIDELWANAYPKTKIAKANSWFNNRRNQTNSYELQFTLKQEKALLPKGFDSNKKNIIIFNSSEDELKAIQEWETPLYTDQNEAIVKILDHYDRIRHDNLHFYIRIHPNLIRVENTQITELHKLNYEMLTVIKADDKIDTYALMEAGDIVLSFGSSMGIEATYWNKPSILFGNSFYRNLNAAYKPKSYEELYQLLDQTNLRSKPKENALPYGYYLLNYGQHISHFKFKPKHKSTFKKVLLRKLNKYFLFYFFKYCFSIKNWKIFISSLRVNFSIKKLLTFKH